MKMTIQPILVLHRALKDAGIPVDGVSIGDPTDRTTWTAQYQPTATAAHRSQGDSILATLDPQDPTTLTNVKTDVAISQIDADVLTSMAQALWECIPSPLMTKLQLRARFIAILKAK